MNTLYNAGVLLRIAVKLALLMPVGAVIIGLEIGGELAVLASAALNKHVGI